MKIIFNVKGTHYARTLHKRKKTNSHYVVHNGRRFTVVYTARSIIWIWAPWCDDAKKLGEYHK